jgi:hypothetical protein
MITPDSPDRVYSTRLRTAVVLTGSGTAGAYHAGVLRALHEAGIKIDVIAGRGIGALSAVFAAVDGGGRLWDADGIWKGPAAAAFYGWRGPLKTAGWTLVAAAAILAVPLLLLATAIVVGIAGLLVTLVGFERFGSSLTAGYSRWIATLFSPDVLPTVIPRLVLFTIRCRPRCSSAAPCSRPSADAADAGRAMDWHGRCLARHCQPTGSLRARPEISGI